MHRTSPLVIAHRGASGYLPEHTLAAKALAHGMGADFLEQDVVLTRDGVPIVLHDIFLDSTTDVARRFPGRAREDGHYHAIDFTLSEIRELRVHERRNPDGDPVYPGRFPTGADLFSVPTLEEEIALIAGLDRARGTRTGLYVELKSPNRHRAAGLDPCEAVLDALDRHGYGDKPDQVFLQCFDPATLKCLRDRWRTQLPLVQLLADNAWGEDSDADYDYLRSNAGLDEIAGYADGIGPWLSHIYLGRDDAGEPRVDDLVARAQSRGLDVHPYTFRSDDLPAGMPSFEALLELFIDDLGVNGLFTDFPDTVANFVAARSGGADHGKITTGDNG